MGKGFGLGRLHRGGGDPVRRLHGHVLSCSPPKEFGVSEEQAGDVGVCCGGRSKVYVEAVS